MAPLTSKCRFRLLPSLAVATVGLAACNDRSEPDPGANIVGKGAYVDENSDGQIGAGDVVLVRFDRDVVVQRNEPVPFTTRVEGDSFGDGARVEGSARPDEVRVVLGTGASLRAPGPYRGNVPGSPSALALPRGDTIVEARTRAAVGDDVTVDLAAGFVVVTLPPDDGQSVVTGDLDGDGDLDLVIGRDGGAAHVLWNDGAATFAAGPLLGEGRALALADLDRDGDLDVVVGSDDVATTVWSNDGSGAFTSVQSLTVETTVALATGDLDGDGDDDLVRGNGPADADSVWWNDGTGVLTPGSPLAGGNTHCVTLADVDGDSDLDVLQGRSGPSRIWHNAGQGSFVEGQSIGSGNTHSIAAGDFDCDGDLDLLTGGRDPSEVWTNDGGGTFTSTGKLANAATDAVRWIDFDGDGRLDAYAANANGQDDELWYVDTDQVLRHSGTSITNGTTNDAAVGDFDGDGDLDVITIGGGTMQLVESSLSASQRPPVFVAGNAYVGQGPALDLAAADFDRDGDLDLVETMGGVRDTLVWLSDGHGVFVQGTALGFGPTHAAAGDVNGDGDVDLVATGATPGLQTWTNTGTGFGQAPALLSANGGRGVLLHDVDGDGDRDLVHSRGAAGAAELWLNDGAGAFTLQVAPALPTAANAAAGADLDRDGDVDLLFATDTGLVVMANAGDGTFPSAVTAGTAALVALAVGDVDRDGDADVAVGGDTGHAIWLNTGGTFAPVALAGLTTKALLFVDLDGDGDLDLLRGGSGADEWWRNDAGTFVSAPIDLTAGPTNDFVVLDIGCDAALDIIVADGSAAGGFRVFLRT